MYIVACFNMYFIDEPYQYIFICMYVCMYVCIYIYIYLSIYVCMYVK